MIDPICLPWPSKELSPNARLHWAKRDQFRMDAISEGRLAVRGVPIAAAPEYQVRLIFCPPDRTRRDLDNMFSRMKHYLDGVCAMIGIDDSSIKRVTLEWGKVCKPGAVLVWLEPLQNAVGRA